MDEKVLMKKDVAMIIKIDDKLHYDDVANVKKIHDQIVERQLFKSVLGTRYVKKLEQIINGENNKKCVFCGKEISNPNNTVMCVDCATKFVKKDETSKTEKSNSAVSTETTEKVTENNERKQNNESTPIEEKSKTSTINKAKDKKKIVIGLIVIVIALSIIAAIGVDTVFSLLMLASLGYLIYTCIKKKPKRNAIIVFIIFFVLTGITNMSSSNSDSNEMLAYLGTSQ